jgi:hypothetical protein
VSVAAGTERRRQRAPRASSLRVLVRWAVKCDSAEELGKRLKRRYERQQQRQGIETGAQGNNSHSLLFNS